MVRKYPHVHYFHSYELVMSSPREAVFLEDGRHVQLSYVAGIMQDFERAFLKSPSKTAPQTVLQPPHRANSKPSAATGPPVVTTVNSPGPGPVLITVE